MLNKFINAFKAKEEEKIEASGVVKKLEKRGKTSKTKPIDFDCHQYIEENELEEGTYKIIDYLVGENEGFHQMLVEGERKKSASKWYNPQIMLNKYPNAIYHFALGGRSIGKSFAFKLKMIDDFLDRGANSCYVRRYVVEMAKVSQFFDDIVNSKIYEGVRVNGEPLRFEVKKMKAYINGIVFLHFIPLSTSQNEKSNSYPTIENIVYDEFVVNGSRYLKDEFQLFNDLYYTICRERTNVKAFLLANSLSLTNTYFTNLNIKPKEGEEWFATKDKLAIANLVQTTTQLEEELKLTPFALMLKNANSNYFDFAFNNKALKDNTSFIIDWNIIKTKHNTCIAKLIIENIELSIILTNNNNKSIIYITSQNKQTCKKGSIYSLDELNNSTNTNNILKYKRSSVYNTIYKNLVNNNIYYDNIESYNLFRMYH